MRIKQISLIVGVLVILAACTAQLEPLPAPLPTAEMMTAAAPAPLYFPLLIAGPEPQQGLAMAYSAPTDLQMRQLGIDWYYDYALRYPFPARGGAEYVPFLWCDIYPAMAYDAPAIRYFDALRALPNGYAGPLLFLNEPDLRGSTHDGGQCERTPRQAAYMLAAARQVCPRCIIIGPAASHEDYLARWPWLREFYNQARRIGVRLPDVAAVHDYTGQQPGAIVDSLFGVLAAFPGAPETVWVTEFTATAGAELARAVAYYKSDERVIRYAYFTARGWRPETDLLTPSGGLTDLGQQYEAYP